MDNACVLGYGVVGRATAEVFGVKKYYSRSSQNITLDQAKECKYIFVCLPTNVEMGKYVTTDIEDIIQKVATKDNIIILRSTIYPGFSRSLYERFGVNIVFNPEFLNEDTAVDDAKNPDLVVIGADNNDLISQVRAMYASRFPRISPIATDLNTAEFIKLGLNAFFATKVVFANQMYDYAQVVGANYEQYKQVIHQHRWGTRNHFDIFHKNGRGAGGKCLRKDLSAIAHYSQRPLLMAADILNRWLLKKSDKL